MPSEQSNQAPEAVDQRVDSPNGSADDRGSEPPNEEHPAIEPSADPFCGRQLDVYLALEGGGAKGIAHLAALMELEASTDERARSDPNLPYRFWPRYMIRGVSGTSIGALFATLIAVGYKSSEILDTEQLETLVASRKGWRRIPYYTSKTGRLIYNMIGRLWNITFSRLGLPRFLPKRPPPISPLLSDLGLDRKITGIFGPITVFRAGFVRVAIPGWWYVWLFRAFTHRPLLLMVPLTLVMGVVAYPFAEFANLVEKLILHIVDLTGSRKFFDPLEESKLWDWVIDWLSLVVVLAALLLMLLLPLSKILRGPCSTATLRNALNRVLIQKLQNFEPNGHGDFARNETSFPAGKVVRRNEFQRHDGFTPVVRFGDVGRIKPLRVITTDIRHRKLRLWSEMDTPHAEVAAAVAASMALPLIFRPVGIDGAVHCDGGLTSNLPAWVWDAERSYFPDAFVIAVETEDAPVLPQSGPLSRVSGTFRDFGALVRAAVFGARALELKGLRRVVIPVTTRSVNVLDFDMSAERLLSVLNEARLAVRERLDDRAHWRQWQYTICKRVHDAVRTMLDAVGDKSHIESKDGSGRVPFRVRVALVEPLDGQGRGLKLAYAYNFGPAESPAMTIEGRDEMNKWDVDDRVLLPIHGSVCGRAFLLKEACWTPSDDFDCDMQNPQSLYRPEHRYRRRLLWTEAKWIFAIPIFYGDQSNPFARVIRVVSIDSDFPVNLLSREEWGYFQNVLEPIVADLFAQVDYATEEKRKPDSI